MELSRQEYWSGLPFPTPGDLPNPGIKPASPTAPESTGRFFTIEPPGRDPRKLSNSPKLPEPSLQTPFSAKCKRRCWGFGTSKGSKAICMEIVSTRSWHSPRAFASDWTAATGASAIWLCRDWTWCCYSCQPIAPRQENSKWRSRHSMLQGNWVEQAFRKRFSGTDFMIPILASRHIYKSTESPSSRWLAEHLL